MKKVVILSIVLLAGTVWAGTYSGGSGLGKTPYRISNPDDWQELIDTPTDWGKGFVLTADIDFNGQTITPVAADTSTSSGFQGTKFYGTFNGAGFVIKNAVINQPTSDFVGLFGFVGASGQILNFGAKNVGVTGQSSIGILVGENEGTISKCFTLGTANASSDYAGGLVGYNSGTVSLSYSKVILNGAGWHNGGLVGYNTGSALNCYASGSVSGTGNVLGGLVGTNESIITNCYASCWIGNASYRGGLIGYSDAGTITSSYWDTTISTLSASAGGTGKTTAQMKQKATFTGWGCNLPDANWQITENVSCPRLVLLLPAYSGGTGVSGDPYQISTTADWLELIRSASDYSNYFRLTADINFNGQSITPVAANTLSFDQAKFAGILDGNDFSVCNAVINSPLENVVGLFGVLSSSCIISDLMVENISVTGRQYVGGLAAYNQGQILKCGVTGVVTGSNFYVGGLAGWQENLVHQCFADVEVSTSDGYYAGGLIGANSNGTITQSFATGTVTSSSQYAGGLVGYNGGVTSSIQNCYATGDVSSSYISGGLVGGNVCSISRCYSTGFVSGTTRYDGGLVGMENSPGTTVFSYWDTQTSGKTASAAGIGKTTEELKLRFSYPLWDFVNTWKMLGDNYAQLTWSVEGLTTDLDDNGVVNMVDLALFAEHWLEDGCQFPDWCSGCDLNASGTVNFIDYAILAEACIDDLPKPIIWVQLIDPGIEGHESFTGQMSKYETTNYQYCKFLNDALASGDIIIDGNDIKGANGSNAGSDFIGEVYYDLAGIGWSYDGAINGGAARIHYNDGVFHVDNGFENHPVTQVSWYGATAFADYYGYRLPTIWEWRAVADYDGSYIYGCGTTINSNIANYHDSIHPDGTAVVGAFGTYGYGMCDMTGNVVELTSTVSGGRPSVGGGHWEIGAEVCEISYSGVQEIDATNYFSGFRVCQGDPQPDIIWVSIDDPGIEGHEGFTGEMSKYETTNAQYCQFLNTALASGDIIVHTDNMVYAASDASYAEPYFSTEAASSFSQITYSDGTFSVRTRDGQSMADHPVLKVSWYGATAFADYYGWRLPTEWEWQAVADYDGSYTYGCGTTIDISKANFAEINPLGLTSWPYTTPVGHYAEYGYGMADMAGNVWEWTSSVSGSSRVLRGGGWDEFSNYCAVSYLGSTNPCIMNTHLGFRVCRGDLQPDITWVSIDDPGVTEHEGFTGQMSKYETTNAQYCQFLNNALVTGDIAVDGYSVHGADGSNSGEDFVGQTYYYTNGTGFTYDGATNGGKSRISYSDGEFTVEPGFENHPVTYVGWYGAAAFANYYDWRLPTEWEWQAVADYDGSYTYGCGTTINNSIANYCGSTHPYGTTEVGSFGTYGYDMANMTGNVSEWTSSISASLPDCKIIRGSNWFTSENYCAVSSTANSHPNANYYYTGFRVCR